MRIVFLGTSGSIPTKDRNLPSLAVHINEWILLDCGEGTQRQMIRYRIPFGSVSCVFISHAHLDHYLGIYGYFESLKLLRRYKKLHLFIPSSLPISNVPEFVEIHRIKEGKIYENKEYEVFAFPTKHSIESYGFRVCRKKRRKFDKKVCNRLGIRGLMFREIMDKGFVFVDGKKICLDDVSKVVEGPCMVYSSDTMFCKRLVKEARGVNLLIHESMFCEKDRVLAEERAHSTAVDAAKIAKEACVKTLALVHISQRYKDRNIILEEAKKIFGDVFVPDDGDIIEI